MALFCPATPLEKQVNKRVGADVGPTYFSQGNNVA